MNLGTAIPAARSTLGALVGQTGDLFTADSVIHRAVFALDPAAKVPGSVRLFASHEPRDVVVRLAAGDTAGSAIRTVSVKFPDAYGPGRDQDFLLASSGDGAPLHHVTVPVANGHPTLYSSLWLYLAGVVPTLFGLRADAELGEGAVAEFCVSAPIGKFRRIGTLTLLGRDDALNLDFAAGHSGGNIRPLPPVSLY